MALFSFFKTLTNHFPGRIKVLAFSVLLAITSATSSFLANGQEPDSHLVLFKDLLNRQWSGILNAPDGSSQFKVNLRFDLPEQGKVIKYTRSIPGLNSSGEGFIYWDDTEKNISFFFIEDGGVFQKGIISGNTNGFTIQGRMTWPRKNNPDASQSYNFRNTFETDSAGQLVDSFFQDAFGPWLQGHTIVFTDSAAAWRQHERVNKLIIASYVMNETQAREMMFFVKSLRENGGSLSNSVVYICVTDRDLSLFADNTEKNVVLIPLDIGRKFIEYPLAVKAYAAARVEEIVRDLPCTLAWFDPGTLIINEPDCLLLEGDKDVAVRPVTLQNNIGIAKGHEPDPYWQKVYSMTGIDYQKLPAVRTVIGNTEILPYYNCEVFSVKPGLGILSKWRQVLEDLLMDNQYQKENCSEFIRQLFLHQVALSAVISSKVPLSGISDLPLRCGYPFNQYDRLGADKKVNTLNECSVVIFDQTLHTDPGWLSKIPVTGDLARWLQKNYPTLQLR